MISQIAQGYVRTENFITNFLIIGVVFFVFFASVMRWVGYPIPWTVEFAQLLFVWVIFLGANRALRENRHIGVDFFTKKMPPKVRAVVEIIMMVFVIAFLIFICIYGILLSIENSVRLISNLTVSYSFVTASVPIGCILMMFTMLSKIKEKIVSFKTLSN
jgi:TRAP-type C4-dicarboxylate transport system permease small subunit